MSRDKKDKNWLESQIKENHIKCIDYSEFSDLKIVGEGGSGSVYKASWKSRRMIVALKFFKSDANDQETDKTPWKEFIRELTNLRNIFYHPHINQFIGITKGGDIFDYAMVLQYADGGNLQDYLKNKSIVLTWSDNYRIALEISRGLLCLHAEGIVQRDLHSKNILIHQGKMLIADFGLSKEETASFSNSKHRGMPAYMDPQCVKQIDYKRNKKSDIFSFGMILWEISSRRVPFANLDDYKVIMRIAVGDREDRVDGTPEPYFQLYSKCWKCDPKERPHPCQVLFLLAILQPYDLDHFLRNVSETCF